MVYSPLALDDLDGIWDYLAVDQGVPSATRAVVGAIVDRVSQLSAFPLSGTPLVTPYTPESQYRYVVAKGYLAFYRVQEGIVYVDRVLHMRRDCVSALLGEVDDAE